MLGKGGSEIFDVSITGTECVDTIVACAQQPVKPVAGVLFFSRQHDAMLFQLYLEETLRGYGPTGAPIQRPILQEEKVSCQYPSSSTPRPSTARSSRLV